jgi:hypothetical protein
MRNKKNAFGIFRKIFLVALLAQSFGPANIAAVESSTSGEKALPKKVIDALLNTLYRLEKYNMNDMFSENKGIRDGAFRKNMANQNAIEDFFDTDGLGYYSIILNNPEIMRYILGQCHGMDSSGQFRQELVNYFFDPERNDYFFKDERKNMEALPYLINFNPSQFLINKVMVKITNYIKINEIEELPIIDSNVIKALSDRVSHWAHPCWGNDNHWINNALYFATLSRKPDVIKFILRKNADYTTNDEGIQRIFEAIPGSQLKQPLYLKHIGVDKSSMKLIFEKFTPPLNTIRNFLRSDNKDVSFTAVIHCLFHWDNGDKLISGVVKDIALHFFSQDNEHFFCAKILNKMMDRNMLNTKNMDNIVKNLSQESNDGEVVRLFERMIENSTNGGTAPSDNVLRLLIKKHQGSVDTLSGRFKGLVKNTSTMGPREGYAGSVFLGSRDCIKNINHFDSEFSAMEAALRAKNPKMILSKENMLYPDV